MVIDFALPVDHDLEEGYKSYESKTKTAVADYALHMAVTRFDKKVQFFNIKQPDFQVVPAHRDSREIESFTRSPSSVASVELLNTVPKFPRHFRFWKPCTRMYNAVRRLQMIWAQWQLGE